MEFSQNGAGGASEERISGEINCLDGLNFILAPQGVSMRLSLSMEVPCPLIMAKRQNKVSKQPAVLAREGGQEIVGIVLILAGILLFVSFLRFTPVDFVGWKVFGGFAPE
ncbi:hypothetical protein N9173_01410, partial [bacterium]|nr:hypothetical protein [bacterium]